MAHLLKSNKRVHDEEPQENLTRFKLWHVRESPKPKIDQGIDPHGKLTRMDHRNNRAPVEPTPHVAAIAPSRIRTKRSIAADLHATDPISIDVLHRALPLRCANIEG